MAPAMTNTVLAVAPSGGDMEAAKARFQRFGEVLSISPLPSELCTVAVVFFDVRSAARAVKALGKSACRPGPQTGERCVRLPADADFEPEDVWAISDSWEEDDGYVFEFFDIRIAARYSSGSAPPEEPISAPPGLSVPVADVSPFAAKQPAFAVQISGLPSSVMTKVMLEVVLEQAGFDEEVVGMSLSKASGEAIVSFECPAVAQRCAAHFRGCRWDQSSGGVTAKLLPSMAALPPNSGLSAAAQCFHPTLKDLSPMSTVGSPEAYISEASTSGTSDMEMRYTLSAEAPAFVPGMNSAV
mmetsp:Transcript_57114/g.165700  ORF Transcript_57114/g.165700 Transcript_57114/m.165700 type:complete len:299 (+) Transcript_57114:82-978(+)